MTVPTAPARGKVQISASILSADFTRLGEAVSAAEQGGADMIQVDVMDGRFVPPITMGAVVVEALRRATALPLDLHLMVVEPSRHLAEFARAGATNLAVHIEATVHPHRDLEQIRSLGMRAGIAFNPGTPPESCSELLDLLDFVLVMSVNPGYSGQEFIPASLEKVRRLRQMLGDRPVQISLDGGVSADNAAAAVAAGADVLVAASAIFGALDGIEAAISRIRAAAGA